MCVYVCVCVCVLGCVVLGLHVLERNILECDLFSGAIYFRSDLFSVSECDVSGVVVQFRM